MKPNVIVPLLMLLATYPSRAVTVSQWTFETSPPADLDNSASISGIAADIGNGSASGVHASANTDWRTPAGNGSANSLSVNTWAIGDYWQFQISTLDYQDLMLNWHQTRTGTGPGTFDLAYSLDGNSFTILSDNYAVNEIAWSSSGSPKTESAFSLDLSSVADLDDHSTVYFRVIADAAPGSTSGGARIDDFLVSATPIQTVPEPGSALSLFSLTIASLAGFRRLVRGK